MSSVNHNVDTKAISKDVKTAYPLPRICGKIAYELNKLCFFKQLSAVIKQFLCSLPDIATKSTGLEL